MNILTLFGERIAEFAVTVPSKGHKRFYIDAFLNIYGCLLGGIKKNIIDVLAGFYNQDAGGTGRYHPIGRRERMSIASCVAVDALSMADLAYDDIQYGTTLHPAGPVAAAILGLARRMPISGIQAIQAFQVGMEVECRMAVCMLGEKAGAEKGWFPTGITGGIGAASACGYLFGFNKEQMQTAQALAAVRACGNRGTHGSNAAMLVHAIAAESGYTAAALTANGFNCSPSALTGKNGLIRQLAHTPNVEEALAGLGEVYVCESTSCKPYQYGFIAFAVIDCCEQLNRIIRECGRQPAKLTAFVSPDVYLLGREPDPQVVEAAAVSLKYLIQMAVLTPEYIYRELGTHFYPREYANGGLEVELVQDLQMTDEQARLYIEFTDTSTCEVFCSEAPGSPKNPMSTQMVKEKFLRLAMSRLEERDAVRLMTRLENIDEENTIKFLIQKWSSGKFDHHI